VKSEGRQSVSEAPAVSGSVLTKQGADARRQKWFWVEVSIWTDRMLAALGNGVKGGKCFLR